MEVNKQIEQMRLQVNNSSFFLGIKDVGFIPLKPYSALVTWTALWDKMTFNVTYFPRGTKDTAKYKTASVIGEDLSDKNQKMARLTELHPFINYTVIIRGCMENNTCGLPTESWVHGKSEGLLKPRTTTVEATGPFSLHVNWAESRREHEMLDTYLVRCCVERESKCVEVETTNNSVMVSNLYADTVYTVYVGAVLMGLGWGKNDVARFALEHARTWSLIPSVPELQHSRRNLHTIEILWRFNRTALNFLQISRDNSTWKNCDAGSDCLSETKPKLTERQPYVTGIVILSNLEPNTVYTVFARGCTSNGCGSPGRIRAATSSPVPASPSIEFIGSNAQTSVFTWNFKDTEMIYIQVSLDNSTWLNCSVEADKCRISRLTESTLFDSSGITTINDLAPGVTHTVFLRGCNFLGCGMSNSSEVHVPELVPRYPTNVTFTVLPNNTAVVKWIGHSTLWDSSPPYDVTWKCGNGPKMVMITTLNTLSIHDFIDADCQVWVTAVSSWRDLYVHRSHEVRAVVQNDQ
ncbi:uncharacterized protein LOC120849806 [Ixodes scapularis]|uniref:uncharacterized protein LOC120849806 n=1 Tax=Ixodes scapularis TaxID=6945 RepID=UPI001C380741|nr:uncharacterized protein LOC120849806 [Ixodes scapularis]